MNHPEIIKLQKYLQLKFNNRAIDVRPRKQNDSVEVATSASAVAAPG